MSRSGAAPHTLDDVIAHAIAVLVEAGIADYPHADGSGKVEILVGERHRGEAGRCGRVLWIPDEDPGEIGGALEIGARDAGTWTSTCAVYVTGPDAEDDRARYAAARDLVHDVVRVLRLCGIGRTEIGQVRRLIYQDVTTWGEEYRIAFRYTWGIPQSERLIAAVERLLPHGPPEGNSPIDPDRPNGPTEDRFTRTIAMEITR